MSVDIRGIISERISEILDVPRDLLREIIEVPPNRNYGDYAFPCFRFAQQYKKSPPDIASIFEKKLVENISRLKEISSVKAVGPYLNIFLDRSFISDRIVAEILEKDFSISSKGLGKTVVIDYSSPNVAKPFGIGHLRSTVIGNSLKNIFSFLGYRVIGINHLGDWGTQFGKLITAYKNWGDEDKLSENPVEYLYQLYVRFHREAENNPELEEDARMWFKKLEEGDSEARSLWRRFRELSIEEFKRIYSRLGVDFDYYTGESFYEPMLGKVVEMIKNSEISELSDGALIVPLEDMPPALIQKKDGATLYLTRDIAAAVYRYEQYRFDLALYVVGAPQSLHFKQLFSVLKKLGYEWYRNCHHVPFGHIRFEDESMSTRKGNIILLEEVLNKAVDLALKIIEEKNPSLENKSEIAEAVGIGAVIFNDLKNSRIKDIVFRWDEVLNFDGETGPYVQYTYARIRSLLAKYNLEYGVPLYREGLRFGEEVYPIVFLLNQFEDVVLRAASEFEPSIISRFVLDVCSEFNSFYNKYRVIGEESDVSLTRALVVKGVEKILYNSLNMLGIKPVENM